MSLWAVRCTRSGSVALTWAEDNGWCAGMHHDPTTASLYFLHSGRFPSPGEVVEFVVGLAQGQHPS